MQFIKYIGDKHWLNAFVKKVFNNFEWLLLAV